MLSETVCIEEKKLSGLKYTRNSDNTITILAGEGNWIGEKEESQKIITKKMLKL